MPSEFSTSLDGLNKINNSLTANKTSSIIKDGGTATNLALNVTRTSVSRPSGFDGSSNDGITVSLINSTGVVGNTIAFAVGSGIGTADQVRKNGELTVGNYNNGRSDPLHDKIYDREQVLTGLTRRRDGSLIDVSGTVVTTPTSATGTYQLVAASGGDENTRGRAYAQDYSYKLGNKLVDQQLPKRTG